MKANYVYKKENNIDAFTSNGSIIELKEYMNDLVLYSPMNDLYRAEFALVNKAADFTEKPSVYTGGPFGSYLRIKSPYSFELSNFSPIKNDARISFWLGNNRLTNSAIVNLVAKDDFPESGLPKGDYSLTVTVEGQPTSTMIIKCEEGTSVSDLRNQILFDLDPKIYPFELNTSNGEDGVISLQSTFEGKPITVSDGLDGTSLLKYFDVKSQEYGSAPVFDNTVLTFFNLTIKHIRNDDTGNSRSFLRFILVGKEDVQTIDIPWNNNSINLDNIEIDFDTNVIYIFTNGELQKAEVLKVKFEPNNKTLTLCPESENEYSFDELIINNRCVHTKNFDVPKKQLTKYRTTKPYIDYHFAINEIKQGMILKTNSQLNIHCCLYDDNNFYYYNAGAWRKGDGTFADTNDWTTFSEKIRDFDFTNDFFIRCYFVSDGITNSYLDVPYFEIDNDDLEDEDGNTAAVLIGIKEWNEGETINLKDKKLIIETDQGITSIDFDKNLSVNTDEQSSMISSTNPVNSDDSNDSSDDGSNDIEYIESTEDNDYWTISEVVNYINSFYPDGIAKCYADSRDRVVLISETKGSDAYISVSGEAAPYIFGLVEISKGKDANEGTIDYSKFFNAVREYSGKPLLTMEVTDEQMKLFLKEALYYYKKWRATDINQYTCTLKGNWKDGFEIPSVIENQKDIVDLIFKPIFPITFYGSDFIANGAENIFTLTLAQSLFAGRGGMKQSQGITQDYYISLMAMQDFRQTLGLNPTWEIMNNRIYIFPSSVARFTTVAIKYKAPLSEEQCLQDADIIKYVHGKCLMTIGNIRGQYGSTLSSGENALTFNADALYERGKTFVDEVISEWKKQQPPLGFQVG